LSFMGAILASMNYWISPVGTIIPVADHYIEVCRFPDRFDLSRDHVKEARGAGAKGSEDLMRLLLKRDWIRITGNGHFFTLEFASWSLLHRGHIRTWMKRERGVKVHLVSLDGKFARVLCDRGQI
jgi:hypothetical protein